MRISTPAGPVWLGYCTNVRPCESPDELERVLLDLAAPLARRVAPGGACGVGLHLTDRTARETLADPARLARLRDVLGRARLVPFTVNAFPIGGFHDARVKEAVYRPDWTEPARANYTLRAARLLAALLPEGETGTISTVAGGAAARIRPGSAEETAAAASLVHVAGALRRLSEETGRRIVLCLEPEPLTMLETTEQATAFFRERLPDADPAVRDHLALCYDCCHQAVEHEDLPASLARLAAEGVPVGKVQVTSAVEVTRLDDAALAALRGLVEPRWLHQVIGREPSGEFVRASDLPEVLADLDAWRPRLPWRIHFHVPIEREALGPLRTTRADLEAAVLDVVTNGRSTHLEVETYTWSALPDDGDADPLLEGLVREMESARDLVTAAATSPPPPRPAG